MNIDIDSNEYNDLENRNVPIIRKDDLPSEFSDNAYRTIVEFIQKTRFLDYEWAIFFDYNTGEILKCAKGIANKVKIDLLLKYISNKNINDIELTKKEYVDMTNNSESCVAEFEDFKHISNPEDYKLVNEFLDNPDSEINKQRITDFFAKMNVEIDADALAKAMPKYKKLYNF